jgi:CRP/FNR family transcriptional regulator, cyclic AMP receptor protein
MRKDAMVEFLRSVSLFQGLSKRELRTILQAAREEEFPPGRTILQEGLQGTDFYVILTGQAAVRPTGKRKEIFGPGDYFGELSVIDGQPRSATVTADTRVFALRLERSGFFALLERNPKIAVKVLVEVCRRLRSARPSPRH